MYFSDAELEAKLNTLRKEDPNLRCPYDRKVVKLCTNSVCKYASLRCSDADCVTCGQTSHPSCESISLEDFLLLLNQRGEKVKNFMVKVLEIEEVLIDAVRRSQRELINKYSSGFKEEIDRVTLNKLFEEKSSKELRGKNLNRISQQLKNNLDFDQKSKQLLERYSKQANKAAK